MKDLAKELVAAQQLDPFSGGGGHKKARRGGHSGGYSGRGAGAGGSFTRQFAKPKNSLPPRGRGSKRGDRLSKFKDD